MQLVIWRLVTTCWNKLQQACWNNQLATNLLATCNKPVDNLQQTCGQQAVASHANASWYRLVATSCCKMSTDLLQLGRCWLCTDILKISTLDSMSVYIGMMSYCYRYWNFRYSETFRDTETLVRQNNLFCFTTRPRRNS